MDAVTLTSARQKALAAGDHEAVQIIDDEISKSSGAGMPQGVQVAPQGIPQAQAVAEQPRQVPFGGILRGLRDPIDAGAQLLVRGANWLTNGALQDQVANVDAVNQNAEQDYQQNWRGNQQGFDAQRLVGNVAGAAPLGALLAPARGAMLGNKLLAAAGAGAAGGALTTPVDTSEGQDFATEKAKQMALGAVGGVGARALGSAVSRVLKPTPSANVQTLLDEGLNLTPGQRLSGSTIGNTLQRAEQAAGSIPGVGDIINTARRSVLSDFNRVAVNRALKPIGQALPEGLVGHEAVAYAGKTLSTGYKGVLQMMGPLRLDRPFMDGLLGIQKALKVLPKENAEVFARIIRNEILDAAQKGKMSAATYRPGASLLTLTPEAFQQAQSNISRIAANYMRSGDAHQRELGYGLQHAGTELIDLVSRNAGPQYASAVKSLKLGWANFLRAQRAAGATAAEDGVFSAEQYGQAVKALDRSIHKGNSGKGRALGQDLANAGRAVLGTKVPDSGTAGRLMTGAMVGGAGLNVMGLLNPLTMAAAGAGAAAYSNAGRKAINALLTPSRPPGFAQLAQGIKKATPAIAAGVAPSIYKLAQ